MRATFTAEIRKNVREEVWKKTHGYCSYCGTKFKPWEFCIEHMTPLSRGGTNEIENLVPSCIECNSIKGSKTLEEFRERVAEIKTECIHSKFCNQFFEMYKRKMSVQDFGFIFFFELGRYEESTWTPRSSRN